MIEFSKIQDFVKGKSVALIGNGSMTFNKLNGMEIDTHDIVVRMNRGTPKGKGKWLGSRTDILGVTTMPSKEEMLVDFNPTYFIWLCLNLGTKIPDYIDNQTYSIEYSKYYWPLCGRLGNSCPSTGMQLFELFARYLDCKSITLYGYDFCKTSSWYAKDPNRPGARDLGGGWPAVHAHELAYAEKLMKEFNHIRLVD